MDDDYYGPWPTRLLERPLVVTGPIRRDAAQAARLVASLLGLPFSEVDRLVEHRAGRSLEALLATDGQVERRRLERLVMRRVLTERPAGVIALGRDAFEDVMIADWVSTSGHVVDVPPDGRPARVVAMEIVKSLR